MSVLNYVHFSFKSVIGFRWNEFPSDIVSVRAWVLRLVAPGLRYAAEWDVHLQSRSGFPGEPEAACHTACQEEDGVSWVLRVLYYLGGIAESFAAQRWDGLGSGACCRLARWLCWAVWWTPCADQSALERQPRVRFCLPSLFHLFMTGKGNETTNTEENKLSLVFHSGRSIT